MHRLREARKRILRSRQPGLSALNAPDRGYDMILQKGYVGDYVGFRVFKGI